jgi:hypothetical protein
MGIVMVSKRVTVVSVPPSLKPPNLGGKFSISLHVTTKLVLTKEMLIDFLHHLGSFAVSSLCSSIAILR